MTPETLVRWYYETREDLGAPALDIVKSRGRVYLKVCGSTSKESRRRRGAQGPCSSKVRHLNGEGVYVCGRCGATWPYRDRFALRGEVQESKRSGRFEDAKARWVDIGVLLDKFLSDPGWTWQARLFVDNARGMSRRDLARRGRELYPDADFDWSEWQVRQAIEHGREEWVRRLVNAGIDFS